MILSKIKKHFSIVLVRLLQNLELRKIRDEGNKTLSLVLDSFLDIKSNRISKNDYRIFQECEHYRTQLLENNSLISYAVFGINKKLTISQICQKASSASIWGQFLFYLIKRQKEPHVLEIGTNLGMSGSYILHALKDKQNSYFSTMEGLSDLCKISAQQFQLIDKTKRHEIIEGLYEDTFYNIINRGKKYNFFFIDGNHQKEATLSYFLKLKTILNRPSILLFDDINWTPDMHQAWLIIKDDLDVLYSIDFFKWGLVIIDSDRSKKKKHFRLHLAY